MNNRLRIYVEDPTQTPRVICDAPDPVTNEDDWFYLPDNMLGEAPTDPGTYEGEHGKPTNEAEQHNKWCWRQCERSRIFAPGEVCDLPIELAARPFYNFKPHVRDTE